MATPDTMEENFFYETKLVVLNFMSLLPADLVSQTSSSSGSVQSSGSSLERQKRAGQDRSSPDGVPLGSSFRHERSSSDTWLSSLPSLPETSLVERISGYEKSELDFDETPQMIAQGGTMTWSDPDKEEDKVDHTGEDKIYGIAQSGRPEETGNSSRSPTNKIYRTRAVDRQTSNISSSSDRTDISEPSSLMASTQSTSSKSSSYIDIQRPEIDQLVREGRLPPEVLPLRQELIQEIDQICQTKSRRPMRLAFPSNQPASNIHAAMLTPESEVAEQLRVIGDYVQKEYGPIIERAFNEVASVPNDQLTYELLERIATELIQPLSDTPKRVAALLLFSLRLAMCGKDVRRLVDFTVTFVMKKMAAYILSHGGWSSILALEGLNSPDSPGNISREFSRTDQTEIGVASSVVDLVHYQTAEMNGASANVDSGFPSTASFEHIGTSSSVTRDTTMDSIASLLQDTTVELSPRTRPSAQQENDSRKSETPADGQNDQVDSVVAAARQGKLLRQVSEKLNHEIEKESQLSDMLQNIAVATIGSICVVVTAVIVYKRLMAR